MSSIRYAAFGSNLHPGRLTRRLPAAQLLGSGIVASRRLTFDKRSADGSGKCCMLTPGDGVHVAIYGIDERSKAALDLIEGIGRGYDVEHIDVPGFGRCFTYAADPDYIDARLLPYDWYRDLVVLGSRKLGFPRDYVRRIESQRCVPDPDAARAATNAALVGALRRE